MQRKPAILKKKLGQGCRRVPFVKGTTTSRMLEGKRWRRAWLSQGSGLVGDCGGEVPCGHTKATRIIETHNRGSSDNLGGGLSWEPLD